MKQFIFAVFLIASMAFIFSCGKGGGESLPRDVYGSVDEGAVVKRTPDDKSESISIIPFGTKITLTEKTPADGNAAWYKIKWNGADAWIASSGVSDLNSFSDALKKIINRDQSFIKDDARKFFEVDKPDGIKCYAYTGGEMEPAEMTFLPSGGMILNSKIFSEKYTSYYFTYQFLNDGKLLKITFADSRLKFNDYAEVENGSASVFQIDRNTGSITYQVKNGAFYFMNWGFVSR